MIGAKISKVGNVIKFNGGDQEYLIDSDEFKKNLEEYGFKV